MENRNRNHKEVRNFLTNDIRKFYVATSFEVEGSEEELKEIVRNKIDKRLSDFKKVVADEEIAKLVFDNKFTSKGVDFDILKKEIYQFLEDNFEFKLD